MIWSGIAVRCDLCILFQCFAVDLIWCTNVGDVSIPDLVKHLLERTQSTSWVVVLKALLTMHDVINYGNEVGAGTCTL